MTAGWARSIDEARQDGLGHEAKASNEASGQPALSDSLISRFETICRLYPDRTAATCGSENITYSSLNSAANCLANASLLDRTGIIAIYLDRSIPMLVAMLATLKAGCAYLPLDPTYPSARVAQTIDDANPALLITSSALAEGLPAVETPLLLLDPRVISQPGDDANPAQRSAPDDLAYLMYTSGSTGKPKGVLVTHRNVVRLLTQTEPWFHFDEHDVWTMFHSFAFDFSVWEIWGPLLTGGRLVIVPFNVSRSTEEFYALLSSEQVTVLNQTPSAFFLLDQVEQAGPALPLALRFVIFGGEALQYRALGPWFKRHSDTKPHLINMYGITETTVHVTYRVVTQADVFAETDSLIGEPIPDLQLHLLDTNLQPVADGEEGELCIGGAGVARGYLNRPELTAQRFVPDPFAASGALLYRSGDLARRRADGELVYLGRNDSQVKINGFRIELGEVEAAVAAFPGIRQVCVIAHTDQAGNNRLAAYFVADTSITSHDLRDFLAERSPAQMLPAFYIQVPSIPLTHNGKVDRAALPRPTAGSATSSNSSGTPMQERVASTWRKVLEAPNVSLDDNFFDIGGSSILLVRIRTELQTQLDRQIPITWMFEFTTIRALADKLEEAQSAAAPGAAPTVSAVMGVAQDQARRQREAFARMRSTKGGRS